MRSEKLNKLQNTSNSSFGENRKNWGEILTELGLKILNLKYKS